MIHLLRETVARPTAASKKSPAKAAGTYTRCGTRLPVNTADTSVWASDVTCPECRS